jgi:hypothetical protein
MKTRISLFILIFILPGIVKSQEISKITYFSDLKFSYNISSMTAGGFHFKKNDSLIPFGFGVESSVLSIKRFSVDFGFEFRTTGTYGGEGFMYTDPIGYSGPFYYEMRRTYLDIPFHINYKIINSNLFKFNIVAGLKTTYEKSYYFMMTDHASTVNSDSFNTGIDLGFVEIIKIYDKINFFAGQFRNKYIGEMHFQKTIDLKFGLLISFKSTTSTNKDRMNKAS